MGKLNEIENKIIKLLNDNKSSWTNTYILIREVERDRLYLEENYRSFTAWLEGLQRKTKSNVTVLWRQKRAGKYYEQYRMREEKKSRTVPPIEEIRVSPHNLVMIQRICESQPWMEKELMEKAIHNDISRRELENMWVVIKTERKERGELVARKSRYDEHMIAVRKEQSFDLSKFINMLENDASWIAERSNISEYKDYKYRLFAYFDKKVVACIVENISSHGKEPILHAIITDPFDNSAKDYYDYVWLVGEEHAEDANMGTLQIDNNKKCIEILENARPWEPIYKIETMKKIINMLL